MRFLTLWLVTAGMAWLTVATGETLEPDSRANTTNTFATAATMANSNARDPATLEDRVVLLTADRSDPSVWCMGLLIAPRAVLTYAHCVHNTKKPMAWAYFGRDGAAFSQWQDATAAQPRDGDVGDMDVWGSIVHTTVHPEYVADGSTPTMDLAVLELQEPRVTTDAFSLVANMAEVDAAGAFDLEVYEMSNSFVTTSRDTKLRSHDTFRKVPWSYCLQQSRTSKLGSVWKLVVTQPKGQVCVVASIVEDRRNLALANAFVLLEGKLVGMSVSTNITSSAAHRFIFLSDQAAFITEATQKTEVWTHVSRLVVGGKDTPTLQGFVAGLRLTKSGSNFCLGSLIAPKFVLTAAHCVQGVNFTQVSVGSMYVSTEVDGEQIKVKRVIVHPNYDAPTFRNDYAIVELEYISIQPPVLLYNGTGVETAPGKRLKFYGYGPNSGSTPGQLQSVELPVVDKKQCKSVLQPPVLDDSMLCAGGEEGKDACQGDSGGPLVYETKTPVSLVAMASYGRGCAIKGVPAVYALAAMADDFIEKYVDGHRWITAYGSDADRTTPRSPSSSASPAATSTPSTPSVKQQPTKSPAASQTPCVPPSTPAATRLPNPESRSQPTPQPRDTAAALDAIETQGGWRPVSSILLKDTSSSSLVVGENYSQLTRDVVSSTMLSPRSSLQHASRWTELTTYAGAKSIELYSTGALSRLASLIDAFDARPLRRRTTRFTGASGNTTCVAH